MAAEVKAHLGASAGTGRNPLPLMELAYALAELPGLLEVELMDRDWAQFFGSPMFAKFNRTATDNDEVWVIVIGQTEAGNTYRTGMSLSAREIAARGAKQTLPSATELLQAGIEQLRTEKGLI